MKISCPCGAIISDSTDGLPGKGHLIPDQEWIPLCSALEKVIEDAMSRRIEAEAALMQVHVLLGEASRFVYQCRDCGRLFVNDRQHQTHIYAPSSQETGKEILRSRADQV
jgi:DNA replicative helicase MCM subunit Mcm2 (Cdc46/Mcm family)